MKTIDSFIKLLLTIRRKSCFSHWLLKNATFFPLPKESSALPSALTQGGISHAPSHTREFLHILSKMRQAETQRSRHGCTSWAEHTVKSPNFKYNPTAYSHMKKILTFLLQCDVLIEIHDRSFSDSVSLNLYFRSVLLFHLSGCKATFLWAEYRFDTWSTYF